MKQAVQEIKHQKLSAREGKCQMSVLEAVYLCLPELWPRKCQPGALYLNTNVPNERIRLLKSEEELHEMPENSTNIYRSGIIEKYTDRPTIGRFFALQNLCLVEFAASYYKKNC